MKSIGIIGLDGSGKTTYLMALTESLKRGLCGLSFSIMQNDLRLAIEQEWNNMTRSYSWPQGTIFTQKYIFQCQKSECHYSNLDFQCCDYRGGILVSFEEDDYLERVETLKYIQDSDGIVILIGADIIKHFLTKNVSSYDLVRLKKINYYILKYLDKSKEKPITLSITKSDILTNDEKTLLFQAVKELFPFVFNSNNHIKTLIVPICLGTSLSNNSERLESALYINPNDGNVHIPILFNMYYIIDSQIKTSISFKDIADLTPIKRKIKKELVAFANNNIIEINTI